MNPFDPISPSFGPFTNLLQSKVGVLLAVVWALGFVYVGYQLIVAIAGVARARGGGYGTNLDESRDHLFRNVAALIGLVALPTIYAVLISV